MKTRGWFAAGLGAVAIALLAWGLAHAQAIDADSCRAACYEQHTGCIDACGEGGNPVECDGQCNDELQDCLADCS